MDFVLMTLLGRCYQSHSIDENEETEVQPKVTQPESSKSRLETCQYKWHMLYSFSCKWIKGGKGMALNQLSVQKHYSLISAVIFFCQCQLMGLLPSSLSAASSNYYCYSKKISEAPGSYPQLAGLGDGSDFQTYGASQNMQWHTVFLLINLGPLLFQL